MITRNINDDNTLSYLFNKSDKAAGDVKSELDAFRAGLINLVYPVGSIYMSTNNVSPQTFLGGTWERITGCFLLGATDNGANGGNSNASIKPGYTGGEASHVITTGEMAAHTHGKKTLTGKTTFRQYGANGSGTDICLSATSGLTSGIISTATTTWSGTHDVINANGRSQSNPVFRGFNIDASHTHDSVGSGTAHNNMPPYLAVYMWKRTA